MQLTVNYPFHFRILCHVINGAIAMHIACGHAQFELNVNMHIDCMAFTIILWQGFLPISHV